MKIVKIIAIALTVYVGIVAALGAYVAYFQPTMPGVLVLTTSDAEGKVYDRLLGRTEIGGVLYLNRMAFTAVRLGANEHQRLIENYPMPMWMKILAGFPPRRFLRLDPLPMTINRGEAQNDA